MYQVLAAIVASIALAIMKNAGMIDISWIAVSLPIFIVGTLMYLCNVVYRAAFYGVLHAMREMGIVEFDEEEMKEWLDNRHG